MTLEILFACVGATVCQTGLTLSNVVTITLDTILTHNNWSFHTVAMFCFIGLTVAVMIPGVVMRGSLVAHALVGEAVVWSSLHGVNVDVARLIFK